MEKGICKQLEMRKEYLQQIIKSKEKSLKSAPQGNLRILERKNSRQYYWIHDAGDTNGSYIRKENVGIAHELAQREYDEKAVKLAKKELSKVDSYLSLMKKDRVDDLYLSYGKLRRELIHPIEITDEQYVSKWTDREYEPLAFEEDAFSYYSNRGVRVRSKTEVMIANMLEYYDIPYYYEFPLELQSFGMVRPDFLCLNVTLRKEVIWEHFGMMDNAAYANKTIKKIESYEQEGYIIGDRLIATFESSQCPINSNIIKCKIQKYLLE